LARKKRVWGNPLRKLYHRVQYLGWDLYFSLAYKLELVPNQSVVRFIMILETLYVIKDCLDLLNVLCASYPEFLFWVSKALCLDILDLIHSIFFLLPPLQFFVQKIKNNEIQTPYIISPA
jgi:hypothetical protein